MRFLYTILILAAVLPASANAAHRATPLGIGVFLGEPSGITAKYWNDAHVAFDGAMAYSWDNFFEIWGDYLYHWPGAFGEDTKFASQLAPYVGAGPQLLLSTASGTVNTDLVRANGNSAGLAIRIPLGIEWTPSDPPIGVYFELAPAIGIVPSTFLELNADIGGRWYF